MTEAPNTDCSALDRPEVATLVFHPRRESPFSKAPKGALAVTIPVDDGITVGAYFHMANKAFPNILFFHGNGEIAADYHSLAPAYHGIGVNFMVADYRGYGRSTGEPTCSAMERDSHTIFRFVKSWLAENGYTGPTILMGRSLGSASVLEVASRSSDEVDALVIESGFAYTIPLLRRLGVNTDAWNLTEDDGLSNLAKIRQFPKPALIIHGEWDQIIPLADAQALYEASPSADKTLLTMPQAGHNDVLAQGFAEYMQAIGGLARRL